MPPLTHSGARTTVCFLLAVVLMALATYWLPGLASLLVYDRHAILAGEIWRLATAPLVHFSASHLAWDLLVFAGAGCAAAAAGDRQFVLVSILAGILPGPVLLLLDPGLARYGGLSGPATAGAVYYCLCRLSADRGSRAIWLLILLLIAGKIAVELVIPAPVFAATGDIAFRPLPMVHLISALLAAAIVWRGAAKSVPQSA